MHSRPRLAGLQTERQRGKGTGCHNLASHSGQEQQLQTQTQKAGQSAHACISPHGCTELREKTGGLEPNTAAASRTGGTAAAAGGRAGGGAKGEEGFCRNVACPAQFSPVWAREPFKSDPWAAVVRILACRRPGEQNGAIACFLDTVPGVLLSPPAGTLLSSSYRCSAAPSASWLPRHE